MEETTNSNLVPEESLVEMTEPMVMESEELDEKSNGSGAGYALAGAAGVLLLLAVGKGLKKGIGWIKSKKKKSKDDDSIEVLEDSESVESVESEE